METDITTLPSPLAHHLRSLRQTRNMTLAQLEEASQISRASLSRIETGDVSPTAETLAKLSRAYGLPISSLIAPLETAPDALIPRANQPVFHDAAHGFTRRSLSPPDPALSLEMVEATLQPDAQLSYDGPSKPGHEHHIVLLDGALTVRLDAHHYSLAPGDSLRFRLHGAASYTAGPDGARYILALA